MPRVAPVSVDSLGRFCRISALAGTDRHSIYRAMQCASRVKKREDCLLLLLFGRRSAYPLVAVTPAPNST